MKHIQHIILLLTLVSCSHNSSDLISYQINKQKEQKITSIRIHIDDIELGDKSIDLLRSHEISELWLSNNELNSIPVGLYEINTLKHLVIQRNPKIKKLGKSIKNLDSLDKLWIIGTSIEGLPAEVYEVRSLTQLNLMRNKIASISDSISNLKELRLLDLAENDLEDIPYSINQLENLETLYLNGNPRIEFGKIIEIVVHLKNLKRLYLHDNNYQYLPKSIGKLKDLKNLETLVLQNNHFTGAQQDSLKTLLSTKEIVF